MSFTLSATEVKTLLSDQLFGPDQAYGRLISKDEDRKAIVQAIHGYGCREGVVNKIIGFVYQLFNGIKAIFGYSTYQKARSVLSSSIHSQSFAELSKDKDKKTQAWISKVEKSLANTLLKSCLTVSHQKVSDTDKVDDKFFGSMKSVKVNAILGKRPKHIPLDLYSSASTKVIGYLKKV